MTTPSIDLDTTCGFLGLKGAKGQEDATIVKQLLDAGAIILAKTNPTVFSHSAHYAVI